MSEQHPFWVRLSLSQLDTQQWESLCDGCARCCVVKIEDLDSGRLYFTRAACHLLDLESGRCRDYANRCQLVPDCVQLRADRPETLLGLPASCAYKRRSRGEPLADWHPLISGDPASVRQAGISVIGQVLSETDVHPQQLLDQVFDWDV